MKKMKACQPVAFILVALILTMPVALASETANLKTGAESVKAATTNVVDSAKTAVKEIANLQFEADTDKGVNEYEAGAAIIVNVIGYEPATLRSNLIEDDDVPVYVYLSGTTMGSLFGTSSNVEPLYGMPNIKLVNIRPLDVETREMIRGTPRYIRPKKYSLENLGFLALLIKKTEKEEAIPEEIKLSMAAEIYFADAERTYSLFHQDLMLPEDVDETAWRQKELTPYTFFAKRGALRVSKIGDNDASLTVYSGSDLMPPSTGTPRPIKTLNLKVGETSSYLRIRESQGLMQNAFRIKLADVVDPTDKRVKLKIDVDGNIRETILTEGSRLYPGSSWTIKRIDTFEDKKSSQVRADVTLTSSSKTEKASKVFYTKKSLVPEQASSKDPCASKTFVLSALESTSGSAAVDTPEVQTKVVPATKGNSLINLMSGKVQDTSKNEIIEKGYYIDVFNFGDDEVSVNFYKITGDDVKALPTIIDQSFNLKKNAPNNINIDEKSFSLLLNAVDKGTSLASIQIQESNAVKVDSSELNSAAVNAQTFLGKLKKIEQEFVLCTSVQEYKKVFDAYPNVADEDGVLLADKAAFKIAEAYDWLGYPAQAIEYYRKSVQNRKGGHLIKADAKINQLEKDVEAGASHVVARVDDLGRNVEVKVEDVIGIKESEKPTVILEVTGEGTKTLKPGAKIFGKDLATTSNNKKYVYNWVVSQIKANSIVVEKQYQEKGSGLSSNSKPYGVRETLSLDGKGVYVKEIVSNKFALLTIIPGSGKPLRSFSNFTLHMPVEKRAIQLSPEKISEKINKTQRTIEKLDGVIDKLDNVLKVWKKVCIFTFLFLTIKNSFLSGTARNNARNLVMRGKDGSSGWTQYCKENSGQNRLYSSFDNCMGKNAAKVEKALDESQANIEQINEEMKDLKNQDWYKEVYSKYNDYDKYGDLLGKDLYSKETLRDYRYWQLMKNSQSYQANTGEKEGKGLEYNFKKEVDDNIKGFEFDKSSKSFNRAVEILNSAKYKDFSSKSEAEKRVIFQDLLSYTASKPGEIKSSGFPFLRKMNVESLSTVRRVNNQIVSYSPNGEIKLQPATVQDYVDSLNKLKNDVKTDDDRKIILDHIKKTSTAYSKNYLAPLTSNNGAVYKDASGKLYVFKGSLAQENKVNKKYDALATIEYYANGKPYCVPTTRGNFVKILDFFNDGSAKTIQEWNVGADGRLCTNDDILVRHDSVLKIAANNAYYRQLLTLANKFVTKKPGETITAGGRKWQVSTNSAKLKKDSTSASCYDSMDPGDCKTLFGVCDPVLCPPSRFDLGGSWKVDNVVQTGLIGSIFLGLHNFELPHEPVPICLTGVSAGLKSIKSILESYVNCLKISYTQGKTIGICDKIRSVYVCDIIWREVLALFKVKGGILKWLANKISGTGKSGGGEYLTFQSSFANAEKSASFFFNQYSTNAFAAFNARSTNEIGTTICKRAIYGKIPNFGELIDQLAEPEDPTQYTALMSVNPYSESQSLAQYQVYYHIYAGKTAHSPVTTTPGLFDQGGIVNTGTSGNAGVDYSVYLKNDLGHVFYITEKCKGIKGFIKRGGLADFTVDCVAPKGFNQVCISINGDTKCGFGKISTSFALNYVNDLIVQKEAERNIKTAVECAPSTYSGSTGLLAAAGATQAGITPAGLLGLATTASDFAETGIKRVCSISNPGAGTNSANYKVVGSCGTDETGNSLGSCWIDLRSISIKDAERYEQVKKTFDEKTLAKMKEIAGVTDTLSAEKSKERYMQIEALPKTTCSELYIAYSGYKDLVKLSLSSDIAGRSQFKFAKMLDGLGRNTQCSKVNPEREFKKAVVDFENDLIILKAQFMKDGNDAQDKYSGTDLIKQLNNIQTEYAAKMKKVYDDYTAKIKNLEKEKGKTLPQYQQQVTKIYTEATESIKLGLTATPTAKKVSQETINAQKLQCNKCSDTTSLLCSKSKCHGLGDYCYFYEDKTYIHGVNVDPFDNKCLSCAAATKCKDFNFDKGRCESDKCAELRGFKCQYTNNINNNFCIPKQNANNAKTIKEGEEKCSACQTKKSGWVQTILTTVTGGSSCTASDCKKLGADCYYSTAKNVGECHYCKIASRCSAFNNDKTTCISGSICKNLANLVCEWKDDKCETIATKGPTPATAQDCASLKTQTSKLFPAYSWLESNGLYILPTSANSYYSLSGAMPTYPSNYYNLRRLSISKRKVFANKQYPSFTPAGKPTFSSGTISISSYHTPECKDYGGLTDAFKAKVKLEGYGICGDKCYGPEMEIKDCNKYPHASTALSIDAKPLGTIAVNDIPGSKCYIPYGSYVYLKIKNRDDLKGWYIASDTGGGFHGKCKIDLFTGVGKAQNDKYGHLKTSDVEVWVYPLLKGNICEGIDGKGSTSSAITGALGCSPIKKIYNERSFSDFNRMYGKIKGSGTSADNSEVEKNINKNFEFMGKTIKIHKKLEPIYRCIEQELKKCPENYPLTRSSSFRTKNTVSTFSRHLYGIAFDYNTRNNPYCNTQTLNLCKNCCGAVNTCSKSTKIGSETEYQYCERKKICCNSDATKRYDIPKCYVDAFTKYGFKWGGEWGPNGMDGYREGSGSADYMHFEFHGDPDNLPANFAQASSSSVTTSAAANPKNVQSNYEIAHSGMIVKTSDVYMPDPSTSFNFDKCKTESKVSGDCIVEFSYNDPKLLKTTDIANGYKSSRFWIPNVPSATVKRLPVAIMLHGINTGGYMHKFLGNDGYAKQFYALAGDLVKGGLVEPMIVAAPSQTANQAGVSGYASNYLWLDFDVEQFIDEMKKYMPMDVSIDEENIILIGHSGAGCPVRGGIIKNLGAYNQKTDPKYKIKYVVLAEVCFANGHNIYKNYLQKYPYAKIFAVGGANAGELHKISKINSNFGAISKAGPEAVDCESDIFEACVTDNNRYYGYTIKTGSVDPYGSVPSVAVKHGTIPGIFFQRLLLKYFSTSNLVIDENVLDFLGEQNEDIFSALF